MSREIVLHSPSSTFFLTRPEAHRLLDELAMALNHGTDAVVVADAEIARGEALELLRRLEESLVAPACDWIRRGF